LENKLGKCSKHVRKRLISKKEISFEKERRRKMLENTKKKIVRKQAGKMP
jgi:ribosome maturation protein Sdo1